MPISGQKLFFIESFIGQNPCILKNSAAIASLTVARSSDLVKCFLDISDTKIVKYVLHIAKYFVALRERRDVSISAATISYVVMRNSRIFINAASTLHHAHTE